jgi:hypothetical protein
MSQQVFSKKRQDLLEVNDMNSESDLKSIGIVDLKDGRVERIQIGGKKRRPAKNTKKSKRSKKQSGGKKWSKKSKKSKRSKKQSGGKRRVSKKSRKSKKSKRSKKQSGGKRRVSKKSGKSKKSKRSKKQSGGKRRVSKKSGKSKKSKRSKKQSGGKRRVSKKSKKSKKSKRSKKQSGGKRRVSKKSKKSKQSKSKSGSKRRQRGGVNPALQAHLDLVKFVQDDAGLKGGPALQIFVKTYKDQAKKSNPNMDAIALADAAKKLYQKDDKSNVKKKYEQAVKNFATSRKEKKNSKEQ